MPMWRLRLFIVAPSALFTDHLPHGDGLAAFGHVRELAHGDMSCTWPPGRSRSSKSCHRMCTCTVSGRTARASRASCGSCGACTGGWHRERRFDVAHQLNPVDVGREPRAARRPDAAGAGPLLLRLGAVRAGRGRTACSPLKLRVKRVVRAAQQRRATTRAALDPGGRRRSSEPRAAGERTCASCRTASTTASGARRRLPAAAQDVLFLANLEVRKGIHVLLDAFEALAPRLPDARLLMAGDGPESDAVRRRIRESPALARVELLGHVDREHVLALMQSCDVYCLPSYGEPFGITALEAMACARPVVATAAGGLRHLVPDAGGRKVPPATRPRSPMPWRRCSATPELRRAMGAHNREVVEERFAWSRVGDRLEELYAEAIAAVRDDSSA